MRKPTQKKIMGQSMPDTDWLAQVTEEALEPELEIVDPHHHLWMRLGEPYLLPEFAIDLATGHNVVSTVYAECRSMYRQTGPDELRSLGETEFVTGTAAMSASGAFGTTRVCEAMFGRVDLTLGDRTRPLFERHLERSDRRFRGVRFSTAWDPSDEIHNVAPRPHLLIDEDVRKAAGIMSEMGLSLDCWVYHPQLNEVAQLAAEFPELVIILNHAGVPVLGGPYRGCREEVYKDWQAGMVSVAEHPNVYIKLGALPILRAPNADKSLPPTSDEVVTAWSPWLEFCIELFGHKRAMFESNFPVQKLWASYTVVWNAFKRLAQGASAEQKRWLFADAARAAYRLQDGPL